MNKKNLIIIIVTTFLFIAGITTIVFSSYKVYDSYTLNIDASITNQTKKIGLNTDTDGIHFGVMPINSTALRKVYLNNTYGGQALVSIKPQGKMNEWLTISPNNFILEPNEKEEVSFILKSTNMTPGNYSGMVDIYFLRN